MEYNNDESTGKQSWNTIMMMEYLNIQKLTYRDSQTNTNTHTHTHTHTHAGTHRDTRALHDSS